jgi:hypothetical protein
MPDRFFVTKASNEAREKVNTVWPFTDRERNGSERVLVVPLTFCAAS